MIIEMILSERERAALGSVVGTFAGLEQDVDVFICAVTELSFDQYRLLLGDRMLAWKLEKLKDMGTSKLRSAAKRRDFGELVDRISSLNGERVAAVHGVWRPEGGFTLAFIAGLGAPKPAEAIHTRRSGKEQRIRGERLEHLARDTENARGALLQFLNRNWILPRGRRSVRAKARRQAAKVPGTFDE